LAELERRRKPKAPELETYFGKRKVKELEVETTRRGSKGRFHPVIGMGSCPCEARRDDGGGEGPQEGSGCESSDSEEEKDWYKVDLGPWRRETVTLEKVTIATVKTSLGKRCDEGNLIRRPPKAKRRRCEKQRDSGGMILEGPRGQEG